MYIDKDILAIQIITTMISISYMNESQQFPHKISDAKMKEYLDKTEELGAVLATFIIFFSCRCIKYGL
jgi:hypothetical protein